MALLCVGGSASTEKRFVAASSGAKVIVAEETDRHGKDASQMILSPATAAGETVVAMAVSHQGHLLAACTSEKHLVVWECDKWNVKGERTVSKRVTSLQFSEDAKYLLTADKTGGVARYCVSDLSGEGEELLGHLSMLLDMVMVSHDSHVITCDRDEKIRVSRYPNSYNIETYCLDHTEFVSSLCVCERWPHILLSASGDGTIKSWEWQKGQLLDTYRRFLEDKEPAIITKVVCTRKRTPSLIVASYDGGKFECPHQISLHTSPWSCAFDWSDRLWVCLPHEQDPVQCWVYGNAEFQRCSTVFCQVFNNWELFKDTVEDRDWSSLRKHTFDNMTDYLARKEERILQKNTASAETAVSLPSPSPATKRVKLNVQS